MSTGPVTGRSHFGSAVDAFDDTADRLLEVLRGQPLFDRLFLAANHAGDFSAIWHVLSLARGVARRRPDQVIALAAALGVESLVVNQVLKRLFRRQRPTESGDARYRVRTPSTSSFPSGHASSAAFNATLILAWDGKRWAPFWVTLAGVIGVSRAYVRIHHPSDVAGGFLAGWLLARVMRPVLSRFV